MINKPFLKKARQVIDRKLKEAADELNIISEGTGNIRFDSNSFQFKVQFVASKQEADKAKEQKAADQLGYMGYKLNQKMRLKRNDEIVTLKGCTSRGKLVFEMDGKRYRINPDGLKPMGVEVVK